MLIDWLSVSRTLQAVLPDNVDAFKDFGDDNVFLCVEHLLKVADTPPSPVRASIGSENKELDRAPGELALLLLLCCCLLTAAHWIRWLGL